MAVIMYFLNNNHLIIKAPIMRCYVSPSDMRDRINESPLDYSRIEFS